jgi:hypothetical protein
MARALALVQANTDAQDSLAQRVQRLSCEARQLANEHVEMLIACMTTMAQTAAEISEGGDAYLRRPLLGDVVSSRLRVDAKGLVTTFYGDESIYVYGDRLFVYDARTRRAVRLTDKVAAQRYFGAHPGVRAACPDSYAGQGVPI